ncbi:DUF4255 domain-containing protein [Streptomyces formicae]|uniref:DUF4255 domain-containing protein n=1 Tax=Streptomyces formicae TaxID=1616117 RepID=A0ABY3WM42_9ACTN|nr:DUF4255 domain-containing protein [Streptomyces formicae]UNM13210.1 DUF4255 domain-containing protein [Streptomyces formicae]
MMIEYVDLQLEKWLKEGAGRLIVTEVEVKFDPPTSKNVSEPARPIVDAYLYDVREDLSRRAAGSIPVIESPPEEWPKGKPYVSATDAPPRYLRLSYMITAWAQLPKTAHMLLSRVYVRLAKESKMSIQVSEHGTVRADVEVGRPPMEDRILSELWSTFGSPLTPLLNVTVTVPMLDIFLREDLTRNRVVPGGVRTSVTNPEEGPQAVAARLRQASGTSEEERAGTS